MKWLWWAPDFKGPFEHKPESVIAPIYNSLEDLIEKRSACKDDLYWHSKIDRKRGSYFGSTYFYPYFLNADLAVDKNVEDFDQYDGVIVSELIQCLPYLRKTRKYSGIIIAVPRMPPKEEIKKAEIRLADICLMGFETPSKNIESLLLHEIAHIGTCRFCNNKHFITFWRRYEDLMRRFLPFASPHMRYNEDVGFFSLAYVR